MRFYDSLVLVLAACSCLGMANPVAPRPLRHVNRAVHRRADKELTPETMAEHIGLGPEECDDSMNPSDECKKAIEKSMKEDEQNGDDFVGISGGKLKYSWSSGCEGVNKKKLDRTAYDAWDLSDTAIEDVSDEKLTPIWNTWIGPNYQDFKGRIIGNLGRVAEFKQNKKYDIYITCNDPKHWCEREVDGTKRQVAGYAWTHKGLFWTYTKINLCEPFLKLDTLEDKTNEIEEARNRGDFRYLKEADWQKNMGQFFLHEMMHLSQTSGDSPHIKDEVVSPGNSEAMAYGPNMVHRLAAIIKIKNGGGAERASTNADSYAWFANSVYFYREFGEYPLPRNYKPPSAGDEPIVPADLEDQGPIMIHLGDIDEDKGISDEDAEALFDNAVRAHITKPEDLDDSDEADPNQNVNPPNAPQCGKLDGDDKGLPEDQAKAEIDDFCDSIGQWDNTLIVPLIGFGTGNTKKNGAGKDKALGLFSEGPEVDGTKGKIWSGVTFAREDCVGKFMIASSNLDQDKAECKAHLQTILSGCGGAGGTLRVSCQLWYLKLSEERPSDEHWKDKGDVKCEDTCKDDECRETFGNGPAADTCNCWYENYDGSIAQFNRPDSGKCDAGDVNLGDLFAES